jgi:hypothetical protein
MKKALSTWSLQVLLTLFCASAGIAQAEQPEDMRAKRLQQAVDRAQNSERNARSREMAEAYSAQFRAERQARLQQQSQNSQSPVILDRPQNQVRSLPVTPPDAQGAARMSIDERRALRRQINEAGRELYNAKH